MMWLASQPPGGHQGPVATGSAIGFAVVILFVLFLLSKKK